MAFAELDDVQLVQGVARRERELVQLRFKHSMNQLENSSELKQIRRDIARMRTEARQREIAQGMRKDELFAVHAAASQIAPVETTEAEAPAETGFLSGIVDKLSGNE